LREVEVDFDGERGERGKKIIKLRDVVLVSSVERENRTAEGGGSEVLGRKQPLLSTFFGQGGAVYGIRGCICYFERDGNGWLGVKEDMMRRRESKIQLLVWDAMWFLQVGQICASSVSVCYSGFVPQSERRRGHNGLLLCHPNCLIHAIAPTPA